MSDKFVKYYSNDEKIKELSDESYYREASGKCYFSWNTTHWMPLPAPPKDDE
jgi:hypothetical protein